MNKSVTLRILVVTLLLILISFGPRGLVGASHMRAVQPVEVTVKFLVEGGSEDEKYPPVLGGAQIEMSSESKNCSGTTLERYGIAVLSCEPGTYNIKVTKTGYEEYEEEGYEVTQNQEKKVRLTPSESEHVAMPGSAYVRFQWRLNAQRPMPTVKASESEWHSRR